MQLGLIELGLGGSVMELGPRSSVMEFDLRSSLMVLGIGSSIIKLIGLGCPLMEVDHLEISYGVVFWRSATGISATEIGLESSAFEIKFEGSVIHLGYLQNNHRLNLLEILQNI